MAEISNLSGSENLNTKNGNFICGVIEGMLPLFKNLDKNCYHN